MVRSNPAKCPRVPHRLVFRVAISSSRLRIGVMSKRHPLERLVIRFQGHGHNTLPQLSDIIQLLSDRIKN
jgi:hypothetical protein